MVFIAFMLFTVSTLAVHGKIVSTDGPVVPRGCEGKTFCNIKPADYPQEEIDDFLESNPEYLKRLKRQADSGEDCKETENRILEHEVLEGPRKSGNCGTWIECEKPYGSQNIKDSMPQVIVQSKFFNQTIRHVKCTKPGAGCFESFDRENNPKCKQVMLETNLQAWDRKERKIITTPGLIYVDCVCALI